MSSRALFCALFLPVAARAAAVDWGAFALNSSRAQDPLLITVLQDADLDTALQICRGVGGRAEPYAGDILDVLLSLHHAADGGASEVMLRAILQGLLDPARSVPPLAQRIAANITSLQALASRIPVLKDPQLVAALVRIIPGTPGLDAGPLLMGAANRIVWELRQGRGHLYPQEKALALDLLAAMTAAGGGDFVAFCASVEKLSDDGDLVSAARAPARSLMPAAHG